MSSGIQGLDRAAMEKERLARQAAKNPSLKRARSISPPPVIRPTKTAKIEQTQAKTKPQKAIPQASQEKAIQVIDLDSPSPPLENRTIPPQVKAESNLSTTASSTLQYPNGVVKQTWAFGHERTENDVKLEEVLESRTLKTAVLSAFQWDTDWVFSKVDLSHTKLVFVMHAKDTEQREELIKDTKHMRKSLRLCLPPMDGQINCMHSKLMLLFHPTKLRIAIPSANLVKYDWGETGSMENSVFMIDLPRLPETRKNRKDSLPSFGKSLMLFLEKQGQDQDVRDGLLSFDFAATKPYAFIHSIGGPSFGDKMQSTGFMGLSSAVREHNLATTDSLQIDFAASSIGSLNDTFLNTMYSAAQGLLLPYNPPPKPTKKAQPHSPQQVPADPKQNFTIYFPTTSTVTASTAGGAGTICLARDWFEKPGFPRTCFRDYQSVRKGLLSHNKILYARGHDKTNGKEAVAWVYVGSANLSESAWGKRTWDRSKKEWKIACKNWECGVLIPVLRPVLQEKVEVDDVETESEGEGHDGDVAKGKAAVAEKKGEFGTLEKDEIVGMEVFQGVVDVPFNYPGMKYEGAEPWYFKEH